jgi:hypothetical protein
MTLNRCTSVSRSRLVSPPRSCRRILQAPAYFSSLPTQQEMSGMAHKATQDLCADERHQRELPRGWLPRNFYHEVFIMVPMVHYCRVWTGRPPCQLWQASARALLLILTVVVRAPGLRIVPSQRTRMAMLNSVPRARGALVHVHHSSQFRGDVLRFRL